MAEASGDDGRQLDSIPSGNSGKMLLEWLCPMGVVAATAAGAPTASLPHSAPFFPTVARNPHAAEPCAETPADTKQRRQSSPPPREQRKREVVEHRKRYTKQENPQKVRRSCINAWPKLQPPSI